MVAETPLQVNPVAVTQPAQNFVEGKQFGGDFWF